MSATPQRSTADDAHLPALLPLRPEERAVIDALRDLPFGSVEVVVHDSRIVQIARTQKLRV